MVQIPLKNALTTTDFYHHRFEVWYNNDMKVGDPYVINERGDDFSGANTINVTTISREDKSHLIYFNASFEDYLDKHC
uniref:Uncharacterized protein n=1 Tax=Panagrolaimus davidi TaxID=227884 RepID=A0A914P9P9_9BILA